MRNKEPQQCYICGELATVNCGECRKPVCSDHVVYGARKALCSDFTGAQATCANK